MQVSSTRRAGQGMCGRAGIPAACTTPDRVVSDLSAATTLADVRTSQRRIATHVVVLRGGSGAGSVVAAAGAARSAASRTSTATRGSRSCAAARFRSAAAGDRNSAVATLAGRAGLREATARPSERSASLSGPGKPAPARDRNEPRRPAGSQAAGRAPAGKGAPAGATGRTQASSGQSGVTRAEVASHTEVSAAAAKRWAPGTDSRQV